MIHPAMMEQLLLLKTHAWTRFFIDVHDTILLLTWLFPSLDGIIEGFARYQRLQSSYDDDAIDRLNHIYTVTLLVVFSIFVSGKQYVGNAIECFSAQYELGMSKREYARSYCWLKNTYNARPDQTLPSKPEDRRAAEIPYYQWVPVILLVMAAMFKLPNLIWRLFSYSSGLDLSQTASMIIKTQLMSGDKSKETVRQVAECLDRWLCYNGPLQENLWSKVKQMLALRTWFCFFFWGRRVGTYLSGLYIVIKVMYFTNAVVVFVVLWKIMGSWYLEWGIKLLAPSTNEPQELRWPEVPFFPKTTFCDFDVWQQTNVNTYTIQCTLPINLFNEKIFMFLWFWMTMVTFANGINLTHWIYQFYFGNLHRGYVKDFLESRRELITDFDRHVADNFSRFYLRRDGCFVLHVVTKSSSMVASGDLICELFHIYKIKPDVQKEKGHGDIMYI